MTRQSRARVLRWTIAISGSLLINGVSLTLMALRHAEPRPRDRTPITIALIRPEPDVRPEQVQRPVRPVLPAPAALPTAQSPAMPPPAPSAPQPGPVAPAREPQATASAVAPQGKGDRPALKLGPPGCPGGPSTHSQRNGCWTGAAPADRFAETQQSRETYAALPPGAGDPAKAPPVPGWHYTPPFGLIYVYGPNDKHFLPGFGSSAKPVFEKEELYNVPVPTNP